VWGLNEYGELGVNNMEELIKPTLVTKLDFKVDFVSCGYYHTAIISSMHVIFFCLSQIKL
jgi:hypothetical protein